MNNDSKESLIQKNLFRETCLVMICQELSQQGVGFIDGLITSVFLGSMAMGASGIASPFFSILGVFSGMIMLGAQKLFIDFLGKGDKEQAQSVLSTSLTVAVIISIVLFLILFFGAGPIVRLLGARGNAANLYNDAKDYLISLSLGVPAFILVVVLTPIAQAVGKTKSIALSIITIAVSDIILDLVMAYTGGGLFGIGLASSISQWLGLIVISVPLLIHPAISISLKTFNGKYLKDIAKIGLPKFVKRICNTLRPAIVNTIVITIGGDIAMSAMSMRNNFSSIPECFINGISSAVILLTSLYVGERNKDALKTLRNSSMKMALGIEFLFTIIIIVFASPIASLYAHDNIMVCQYLTVAIRCIAINMPLLALSEIIQAYEQGIDKFKRSNTLSFLSRFVYLVATIFILGNLFGVTGIWMAFPVTSFLTIITAIIIQYIESKKGGIELMFPIPSKCEINDQDKIVRRIDASDNAIEEIVHISKDIQSFCLNHGIDSTRSMFVALCYEEMASNIIEHTQSTKKRKISIDIFVMIIDNQINIRLRDNSRKFDVVENYNTIKFDPDHPEKNMGIRIVMNSAKSVEYVNTFGMNNLIITI